MSTARFEERFLDYIEGTLPEKERRELEEALSSDKELERSFERYLKVIEAEKVLAKESAKLSPHFERKVMERIEKEKNGSFGMIKRWLSEVNVRPISGALAAVSLVIVA